VIKEIIIATSRAAQPATTACRALVGGLSTFCPLYPYPTL
jgi:hypothetical protein